MKRIGILLIVCIWIVSATGCQASEKSEPVTAILGAFDLELNVIRAETVHPQHETIMGLDFVTGEIRGRKVVFVEGGIGKVHSTVAAALIIDHFKPSEVIFTGVAGAINPDLKGGDIVIAEKTAQHDLIILKQDSFEPFRVDNPVTSQKYPDFYPADKTLLTLANAAAQTVPFENIGTGSHAHQPKVIKGIIVSGDMFVSSSKKKDYLRSFYNADAVEMEGAIVSQICYQQGIPCLVIRSVSDGADENADQDFEQFVGTAADNAAKIVVRMLEMKSQ